MSKESTPGSTDPSNEVKYFMEFCEWGKVGLEWNLCCIDLVGSRS